MHMHLLLTKCLNWQSDLIGKDSQQDPPSLTFAHPEQIAKFIGCWSGVSTIPNIIHKCHDYNNVFFLNLNKFDILSTLLT